MFAMEMGRRSDRHQGVFQVRRRGLPRLLCPVHTFLIAVALVLGLLAYVQVASGASGARGGSRGREAVRTHGSAMRFLTGIGDERTEMFTNPL